MNNVYAKWELLAAAADKIRNETYRLRVAEDGFAGYVANTTQEFEGIIGVKDDAVLRAAWHKRGSTLPLFYCHGDELSVSSMSEEDSDAPETEDSNPPPHFPNLGHFSVISAASEFTSPPPYFPSLGQSSAGSSAGGYTICEESDDEVDFSAKFDSMFSGKAPDDSAQSPTRKRQRKE
jgi:hypothetical protein